jgi:hypothetical protein
MNTVIFYRCQTTNSPILFLILGADDVKQFSFKTEKKDEQVLKFLVEKFSQQFFIILQENKQNIMMLYSYLEQCFLRKFKSQEHCKNIVKSSEHKHYKRNKTKNWL